MDERPPREPAREGNPAREIRDNLTSTGSRALRTAETTDQPIPKPVESEKLWMKYNLWLFYLINLGIKTHILIELIPAPSEQLSESLNSGTDNAKNIAAWGAEFTDIQSLHYLKSLRQTLQNSSAKEKVSEPISVSARKAWAWGIKISTRSKGYYLHRSLWKWRARGIWSYWGSYLEVNNSNPSGSVPYNFDPTGSKILWPA